MPNVDLVVLAKASSPELKSMTQQAIDTAKNDDPNINVIVVEQVESVSYIGATTHHETGEFNYNKFANIGARLGSSEWIIIANNDLVFNPGWLQPLLDATHRLVSPKCPNDPRQGRISTNTIGDRIGCHLSGWCFMITRELWEQIGGLDERFPFWCADDSLVEQCRAVNVLPMLVPASKVTHLGSRSGVTHGDGSMTWAGVKKFTEVYGPHRLESNPEYKSWLALQSQ